MTASHRKLSVAISAKIATMLENAMPEIQEAVARDAGQASFSVTAAFGKANGQILCKIQPRIRAPLDPIELRVSDLEGQLSLFVAPPAEEPDLLPMDEDSTQTAPSRPPSHGGNGPALR